MALTNRDKAIIADLNKFRVMDRDTIAELHFGNLRRPKYAANNVLLRLLRDGHIQRSTARQPYVYFGGETTMKKNSAKIDHFLAISNVYKEMRGQALESFLVEPKYGDKGTVEPDIFALSAADAFLYRGTAVGLFGKTDARKVRPIRSVFPVGHYCAGAVAESRADHVSARIDSIGHAIRIAFVSV